MYWLEIIYLLISYLSDLDIYSLQQHKDLLKVAMLLRKAYYIIEKVVRKKYVICKDAFV